MRKFHGTGMIAASTEPDSMAARRTEAAPITMKVISLPGSSPMALREALADAALQDLLEQVKKETGVTRDISVGDIVDYRMLREVLKEGFKD